MKKLLSLLLLLPLFAHAQTNEELKELYLKLTNEAGTKFDFSEVVSVPDKTKNDLYFNTKSFFVEHYPYSNEVIQLDDKDQGVVVGKSSFTYKEKDRIITYYYLLKIQSKDGRCKIDLKDISYTTLSTSAYSSPSRETPISSIDRKAIMSLGKSEEETKKRSIKNIYSRNDPKEVADLKVVKYNYGILKGLEEGASALFSVISKYIMPAEENW